MNEISNLTYSLFRFWTQNHSLYTMVNLIPCGVKDNTTFLMGSRGVTGRNVTQPMAVYVHADVTGKRVMSDMFINLNSKKEEELE